VIVTIDGRLRLLMGSWGGQPPHQPSNTSYGGICPHFFVPTHQGKCVKHCRICVKQNPEVLLPLG
jgi:hypothetical protein